ncbi:MAG: hypothetical protein ACE5J5_06735 [Candidatus Hydrothermarchaeales archaeon]
MAAEPEKIRIFEKAIDILKKELPPLEYVKFLEVVTPKVGDAAKEIRALREAESEPDFLKRMKKKGINVR